MINKRNIYVDILSNYLISISNLFKIELCEYINYNYIDSLNYPNLLVISENSIIKLRSLDNIRIYLLYINKTIKNDSKLYSLEGEFIGSNQYTFDKNINIKIYGFKFIY